MQIAGITDGPKQKTPIKMAAVRRNSSGTISAKFKNMITASLLAVAPMFAAIGYSIIYLLLGGGLGGAVLIFIIARMLGK